MTRRSLGYAYVNYGSAEHAQQAIHEFNNEQFFGAPMRVMPCVRDPQLRKSGVGNIFITGLHPDIDQRTLFDTFSKFGTILSCKISTDAKTKTSRGYGFAHFSSQEEAKAAILAVNGMRIMDKVVNVTEYKSKQTRSQELENEFTNVFVKGLPLNYKDDNLRALFQSYGPIVSLTVRTVKEEGGEEKSKGYGFVKYHTHESAKQAVEALNDQEIEGQKLHVERAMKKAERVSLVKMTFKANRASSSGDNLYVKNLHDSVDDAKLRELFSRFGDIKSVRVAIDRTSGRPRGFGFVKFETAEQAAKALTEMNGSFLINKPIYVSKFQTKEERMQFLQREFVMRNNMPPTPFGWQAYGAPMMPVFPQFRQQRANSNMMMGRQFPPGMPAAGMPMGAPMGGFRPQNFRRPGPMGGAAMPPQQMQQQQQQQQQQPRGVSAQQAGSRRPNPSAKAPLDASHLASLNEVEQKQAIGERLYPLIQSRHGERAGKITGMLLEMDNSELLHMLDDPVALAAKETEALRVLDDHQKRS